MAMPKAIMYENYGFMSCQNNFWRAVNYFLMKSESHFQSCAMLSDLHFRSGVLLLNTFHPIDCLLALLYQLKDPHKRF